MPLDLDKLKLVESLPSQMAKDLDSFETGWYKIGKSSNFEVRKLYSVDSFPSKLVIWRNKDENLVAFDAFCPHLGADLACGELTDKGVSCPFHGWVWGDDGKCKSIPYSNNLPKKAFLRAWQTLEEKGDVFIWYDSYGEDPKVDGLRLVMKSRED